MSGRLYARHGQAPYVGQPANRAPRRDPFNPWFFLGVMGVIVGAAGWWSNLIPW